MAIRTEALRESTPTSAVRPRQGRGGRGSDRPFEPRDEGAEPEPGGGGGALPEGGPLAPEAPTAAFLSLEELREPPLPEEAREAYEAASDPLPGVLDLEG